MNYGRLQYLSVHFSKRLSFLKETAGDYNRYYHGKYHRMVGRSIFWSQTDQGLNPGFATNLLYNLPSLISKITVRLL